VQKFLSGLERNLARTHS